MEVGKGQNWGCSAKEKKRDYRRGFGLKFVFIDHFNTQLVNILNYSAVAGFHTLQITTAHAKFFQSAAVSTSRSLVTASNTGDSSTAPIESSFHRFLHN
jgi:hypothetical protein